jgi:hypothetical protein
LLMLLLIIACFAHYLGVSGGGRGLHTLTAEKPQL